MGLITPEMTPEEAFRYCLENPDNLSAEQLLAKFPGYREELQSLLALDGSMSSALPHSMHPDKHTALKAQLMAAAFTGGPDNISSPKDSLAQRRKHTESGGTAALVPSRLIRARRLWGSLAATAAIFLVVWYLAAASLADSPFYRVKLATENLSLNFAGSAEEQAKAHIDIATQRLYDLRAMQTSGKLASAQEALDNYISHTQSGEGIWTGLKGASHVSLGKLLYVSTIAGQRTFEGFGGLLGELPGALRADIERIHSQISSLNTAVAQDLQAAGINLAQLLSQADTSIAGLLTPVPGVILPTATPTSTATSTATLRPAATSTLTATPLSAPSPVPCLDSYEDDGVPGQARTIEVGQPQIHSFCPAGDADWLRFDANAGSGYMIQTGQLSSRVNTYIYLFAVDGKTLIKSSGDAPNAHGPAQLTFYPTSSGSYYIQVKNQGDIGYPGADYAISVSLLTPTAATP